MSSENGKTPQREPIFNWHVVYGIIAAVLLVLSLLQFGRVALDWLEHGKAGSASLANYIAEPSTTWRGLAKIIRVVWGIPAWIVTFVGSVAFSLLAMRAYESRALRS